MNGAESLVQTLRAEVCRVGRSLFERGLVHATAGNISVRLPAVLGGGFLITPTDACLGFLQAERLALLNDQGQQLSGDTASKAWALHGGIYRADPQAGCVIHTHSTHLVALTLGGVWSADDIVPPITPYFVMKVGHVPLVPYHRPGAPAVVDWLRDRLQAQGEGGRPLRAVMLDRLGPVVWQSTPETAMAVLEELEETARLWLLTGRRTAPLPEEAIEDLRVAFGAWW